MTSYLSRIYSSERISSSHGPDIFYEFVHAHVKHDPNQPTGSDVVIIRMIQDNRPNEALAPEIHVQDLMEVEERFLIFMDRVRKKSGDSTTIGGLISGVSPVKGVTVTQAQQPMATAAIVSNPTPMPMMSPIYQQPQPQPQPQQAPTPQPAATPVYAAQPTPTPEPMGRFAPGAPRKKIGGLPDEAMMRAGPKRSSFALDPNGNVVGQAAPAQGVETKHATGPWTASPKEGEGHGAAGDGVSAYEIVPFSLQKPPDLEDVLGVLASDQSRLVVVARMELMDKIKIYLENVIRGDGALANKPGVFSAIVLHRQGGKTNFKAKMSGPLALAIQQIVANPTKVLWVPPEGAQVSR